MTGFRTTKRLHRKALALLAATGLTVPALFLAGGASGVAGATTAAPVPVAGVDAFGIGAGQVGDPQAVAISPQGDLFVTNVNEVIEFSPNPGTTSYVTKGTVIAGGGGSGIDSLSNPEGLAFDTSGDLFVSNSGENDVLEFAYNASAGTYPSSGTAVAGTGQVGTAPNELSFPQGIAVDSAGDLFVVDAGNSRVEEFTFSIAAGTYASNGIEVAGTGGEGAGATELKEPNGIALDRNGDLFIMDTGNDRVMQYPYNSSAGTYASSGTQIAGSLPGIPTWLAFDASGNLFVSYWISPQFSNMAMSSSSAVSPNSAVAANSSTGGVLELLYNPANGTYATPLTSIAPASLVNPAGLAFNSYGDLLLAETYNSSTQADWDLVAEFTPGTFAPQGTILSDNPSSDSGISAVAVDGNGDLFVSDTVSQTGSSSGIYEFPHNPNKTYPAMGSLISANGGTAMALDSNNNLFVAGATGVVEFPWNSGAGSYPASGVAVPGATQLSSLAVTAMALDGTDDLFVANGNEVLEFPYNSRTGTWASSGGLVASVTPGTLPSGYTNYLQGIAGIALDSNRDLFLSNPSGSQVLEFSFSPSSQVYSTTGVVVAGQGGTGDGLAQLYEPAQLAVDSSDDVYVVDAGNNRVMEFTPVPGATTYYDNGTQIFAGESLTNIGYPDNAGIALDAEGDVFFGNNTPSAVVYEAAAGSNTSPTTTTISTSSTSSTSTTSTTSTSTSSTSTSTSSTSTSAPPSTSTSTTSSPTTTTTPANSFPGWTAVTPPGDLFLSQGMRSPVSCVPGTTYCVAVLWASSVVSGSGATGQGVAVTSNLTNWSDYDSLPSEFTEVVSVSCPTTTHCVAVGEGEGGTPVIGFSTNGGVSWTEANMSPFASAPGWPQAVTCTSALVCYTVGGTPEPSAPMAAISIDGGQDWTLLDNYLPTPQDYNLDTLSCSSASDCVAGGGIWPSGPSSSVSTTSRGTSWSPSGSSTLAQFDSLTSVSCPPGTSVCFAGGELAASGNAALANSTDSGTTWSTVPLSSGSGVFSSISCANALTCWAAGGGMTLSLAGTGNGGSTWQADVGRSADQYGNISCASTEVCIATTNNELLTTSDNGDVTPGAPPTTTTTAPTTTTTAPTTTTSTTAPTTTTTSPVGTAPPTVDGSVLSGQWNSTNSITTAAFSTSHANDVIVLAVSAGTAVTSGAATVSSVKDTAGLTWTRQARVTGPGSASKEYEGAEIWYAVAPAALSKDKVTITYSSANAVDDGTYYLFGLSGANTTTPFDPNASLPGSATGSGSNGSGPFVASSPVSTSAANDYGVAIGSIYNGSSTSAALGSAGLAPSGMAETGSQTNLGGTFADISALASGPLSSALSGATAGWGSTNSTVAAWDMLFDAVQPAG